MTMTTSFGEVQRGVFPVMLRSTQADETTQPFWDAAQRDELVVPRCTSCRTFRLPPFPLCYACQSEESEWVKVPGTGTVYTFTVIHHPLHPELAAVVPYVSAVVELDGTQGEGARMLVNLIDCDPDEVSIGMPVSVTFEHINDEMSHARFRPIR